MAAGQTTAGDQSSALWGQVRLFPLTGCLSGHLGWKKVNVSSEEGRGHCGLDEIYLSRFLCQSLCHQCG